jgi:2,3-bisphosphoglycerate-dependent phosphoglycerate mutase
MNLYFIRHAQSANNALYARGLPGRVADPELTEPGQQQAGLLAEHLAGNHGGRASDRHDTQNHGGFGLTHLYASLMERSVNTGTVVARRLGLTLHGWIDWHETGGIVLEDEGGQLAGLPGYNRAWFAEKYPAFVVPDSLGDDGWWNSQPLEPDEARTERARRVLAELLERHGAADHNVAVISHGGFYNHFLAAFYGHSALLPAGHLMNNTGISRFAFTEHDRFIVYQNRLQHLPSDLVTY